ncbi:MAG: T9SS C-terminal target domain-containing protein, partial [Bacteroidetes bacterium]
TTDIDGAFNFNVPAGDDYTLTPVKDVDPLNGVTTFDLVLISKHILGVQPFSSPYQWIAADANRSNTVTTFDMVEIRKLILFINDEFTNNTSWRFVDKDYSFPAGNPLAVEFPEVINFNNLTVDQLAADFVAVKIGDVNGSASTDNFNTVEDRNFAGKLVFATDDVKVKAGETYTVDFTAKDFNVMGYQFTLNFDRNALEFVEVVPGLADASNFGFALLDEGAITTSWNTDRAVKLNADDIVFSLVFTAKADGQLSDLLGISSRYTVAEAYNGSSELLDIALEFNGTTSDAAVFELYQNTPNPFAGETVIGFTLPEATSATLTITDVSGRVLKVIEGDFAKGYNQVVVKRSELAGSGVLYYQLDTPTDTATRKMILVD